MALLYNRVSELTVERNLVIGVNAHVSYAGGRNVTLKASRSLAQAELRDRNMVMDLSGSANTYTLPAATGSGRKHRFYVGTVNTSNYIVKTARATDLFKGTVAMLGATPTAFTAGASNATFTMNGTTTGGVAVGDWVEFVDLKTGIWGASGQLTFSGTAATPFSS